MSKHLDEFTGDIFKCNENYALDIRKATKLLKKIFANVDLSQDLLVVKKSFNKILESTHAEREANLTFIQSQIADITTGQKSLANPEVDNNVKSIFANMQMHGGAVDQLARIYEQNLYSANQIKATYESLLCIKALIHQDKTAFDKHYVEFRKSIKEIVDDKEVYHKFNKTHFLSKIVPFLEYNSYFFRKGDIGLSNKHIENIQELLNAGIIDYEEAEWTGNIVGVHLRTALKEPDLTEQVDPNKIINYLTLPEDVAADYEAPVARFEEDVARQAPKAQPIKKMTFQEKLNVVEKFLENLDPHLKDNHLKDDDLKDKVLYQLDNFICPMTWHLLTQVGVKLVGKTNFTNHLFDKESIEQMIRTNKAECPLTRAAFTQQNVQLINVANDPEYQDSINRAYCMINPEDGNVKLAGGQGPDFYPDI